MAEIKDKVVTVESLSVLHEHNKKSYMPMVDPEGIGTMNFNGDGNFTSIKVNSLTLGSNIRLVPTEDGIEIEFVEEATEG